MTIVNGYATLADLKQYLLQHAPVYTGTTLGFTASTKKIADSLRGLRRFQTGDFVRVSGSLSNDGYYTVATGNVAAEIVTTEALVDEAVGHTVTLTAWDDLTDDARMEAIVTGVSRAIDAKCRRRFWADASDATRYYRAISPTLVLLDDIELVSITSLSIDQSGARSYTALAATDYDLLPDNAALDGWPYSALTTTPNGVYRFSMYPRGVKIVGKFGFPATSPWLETVREICLLMSARLFKRKDAIYGTAGVSAFGSAIRIAETDPDVVALLKPPLVRGPHV